MIDASEGKARQRAWAEGEDISVDSDGYVLKVEENLFLPMSPATLMELSDGSGNELGDLGRRGKMQALHSSSALAYNVFEYWRQQEDREPLRHALGLGSSIASIRFEGKFSTGLGGPAHVDVVLEVGDRTVGVESKFLEPFWSTTPYATFSKRYFADGIARWTDIGLPRCQALAEQVYTGDLEFLRLDVPQLLKHALGLWKLGGREASLWYLYLELAGKVGARHRMELERFEQSAGEEIGFKALSYDQVMGRLREFGEAGHGKYLSYLENRYGGGSPSARRTPI